MIVELVSVFSILNNQRTVLETVSHPCEEDTLLRVDCPASKLWATAVVYHTSSHCSPAQVACSSEGRS